MIDKQSQQHKKIRKLILFSILFILIAVALKHKQYYAEFEFYKEFDYTPFAEENDKFTENEWLFGDDCPDEDEEILWWTVIRKEEDLKYCAPAINAVDFSDINLNEHNVLLCIDRKINSISYTKDAQFPYLPKKYGEAVVHFNKKYSGRKVFVYLIDKDMPLKVERKVCMAALCKIDY